MGCRTAKRFTYCFRCWRWRQQAGPGVEKFGDDSGAIRTVLSLPHTPRVPARENRKLRRNARSSGCRSGRRATCGDSLRIRLRSSRRNNPRCRNLGRQNSILHARLRILLYGGVARVVSRTPSLRSAVLAPLRISPRIRILSAKGQRNIFHHASRFHRVSSKQVS